MTSAAIAALFSILPAAWVKKTIDYRLAQEERAKYRQAAWEHFKKRCEEDSGERIYASTSNVQGIFLETLRTRPTQGELQDQYWKEDLYGLVMYPPVEISGYLSYLDDNSIPTRRHTDRRGYAFVEAPGSRAGEYVRYSLKDDGESLKRAVSTRRKSRYTVRRADVSTKMDRSFWVAGGRLAVFDEQDNKMLGERIGFVFEPGFGSVSGGRRPWLIAQGNSCPPIPVNASIDRLFVERVLRPAGGKNLE